MYYMKCLHKDVIRASGAGAFTILRRIKRFLQMMALIIIVACMTSVLYQNVHGLKDLEVNVCVCASFYFASDNFLIFVSLVQCNRSMCKLDLQSAGRFGSKFNS